MRNVETDEFRVRVAAKHRHLITGMDYSLDVDVIFKYYAHASELVIFIKFTKAGGSMYEYEQRTLLARSTLNYPSPISHRAIDLFFLCRGVVVVIRLDLLHRSARRMKRVGIIVKVGRFLYGSINVADDVSVCQFYQIPQEYG